MFYIIAYIKINLTMKSMEQRKYKQTLSYVFNIDNIFIFEPYQSNGALRPPKEDYKSIRLFGYSL